MFTRKEVKLQERLMILESMKQQGYFKTAEEYLKARRWIISDLIPAWFINEMKEYELKGNEYERNNH